VRAAQIAELGAPPAPAEVDEPSGGSIVEVEAVSLNPIDVAVAAGRFYGGHPPLPFVPGCEAVGRVGDRRVYVFGDGRGVAKDGLAAERVAVPDEILVELPAGADPVRAAATGIAGIAGWVPVAWKARVRADDRVLVLGATGVVGSVALQAAKLLGAAEVVAAGRRREALDRALELGADAAYALDELPDDLRPTVVIDPLWGAPLARATELAARGARLVNIGQSAGPEATLTSANVRGKELVVMGHSNFALSQEEQKRAYLELLDHVLAGRIVLDLETFPLADVAAAWERQASGGGKAVLTL
jgi:NADPH:quinone reductase-like Zn-dependent oxidoreductase